MSANQATASEFGIPSPDSIEADRLEFKPVSITHLISLRCDCCWYNSSTAGCSGEVTE